MSLSLTRERVKQKCGIAVSDYDSQIDTIIAEHLSVIEFAIRDEILADTLNAPLQATLNLGALEIVSGETLAELHRGLGALDCLKLGGDLLIPFNHRPPMDPFGLVAAGRARLRPFLKMDFGAGVMGEVLVSGGRPSGDL